MWLKRWIALDLFALIQLLVIADALQQLAEDPTVDIWWVGAFGVTIAYFAFGALMLIVSYVKLAMLYAKDHSGTVITTPYAPYQQFTDQNDINAAEEVRRERRVLLGDALVDTGLFVPLVTFFGLFIDQLEQWDDGEPMHNWIAVFIWLVVFFLLLSIVLLISAVRTCGEERLQKGDLPTDLCCTGAFGDVIAGCSLDHNDIEQGRARRADRVEAYVADSEFHAIPCAYLCAWGLTANGAEFVLNWLLYLLAPLLTLLALLLGFLLEDGTPSLSKILVPLWIFEIAIIILAIVAFILLCCDPRVSGQTAPPRFSFLHKYNTIILSFVLALALGIFQILLLDRLQEGSATGTNWHLVFLPLYIVLTIALIVGCCYSAASKSTSSYHTSDYLSPTAAPTTTATTKMSKSRVRAAQRDLQRQQPTRITSGYGLFTV